MPIPAMARAAAIPSFWRRSRPRRSWPRRVAAALLGMAMIAALAVETGPLTAREPEREPEPEAEAPVVSGNNYDTLRVGQVEGRRIVVAANQVLSPRGRQVAFAGRPTDLALSPDGRWIAVLGQNEVLVIGVESGRIVSRAANPGGSYAGIAFTLDGRTVLASSVYDSLGLYAIDDQGRLKPAGRIKFTSDTLPKTDSESKPERQLQAPPRASNRPAALPAGLALDPDGKRAWVVLNLHNTLAEVDLAARRVVREIPVGSAPYGVAISRGKAYVSNWGGRRPKPGDLTGPAGRGTRVRVDPVRHIASEGSVSVVDLAARRQVTELVVGLHPSGIAASRDGRFLCVANANSDTITVFDTGEYELVETISTRLSDKQLFGSAPNALAFNADGTQLLVSNAANNAVAVFRFSPDESQLLGYLPTGWYPAGLALDERRGAVYVANVKGVGSRDTDWKGHRKIKGQVVYGFNSHDYLGTVSMIPLADAPTLKKLSAEVLENNRLTMQVNANLPPRPDVAPRPVPQRHGEPSVFRHVLYIIKENRTYDQVLGDVRSGEGDPALCMYGAKVTPNQHKLSGDFVLLDNFYCNGTLSADGHQWATQSYVTDYLEKAFGGWPRSYPDDGGDALAYASSGFLWDNALKHKKTLRIYGEFVHAMVGWKDPQRQGRPSFTDCYRDFLGGTQLVSIRATARVQTIEPYLCPTAIGFPIFVSDQYRAEQFFRELRACEKQGDLPNLMIMSLPANHTSGASPGLPRPESQVADNDLALGRIVEAVSHSRFWKDTCILVVEDDPQSGFDHIDGRRTVATVVSPYTKRHVVDHTNYNQSSMVRTIELMLGLPPMNQFDAGSTPMASCFTDRPDMTPYDAVPNQIPLDRLNPRVVDIRDPRQRHWAEVSAKLPLDEADEADDDTFNRILWNAARGRDDTYPAWAVLRRNDDQDTDRDAD